ncbi:MAG TPA: hypothetical protein VH561_08165 [Micromonosporaceae bacterium]|jgi:hypothetical protein
MISPAVAADRVAVAVGAQDGSAYRAALQDLRQAVRSAAPDDLTAALVRLAPVLREIPLGIGAQLARLVGSMAGRAADTPPVLEVLVERACQAMELAAQFAVLHREVLGEPPSPTDHVAAEPAIDRFTTIVADRAANALSLVQAWFEGADWVQPVLYLAQRPDIRAALPQRARLLTAVESIRDEMPDADWLHGLLLVLDDAPLVVLHRPTGRGYRLTIAGIGENAQLQTLLAAALIGDADAGLLPGTPPTAEMTAAADGTGNPEPPGGVLAQFTLADPYGWDRTLAHPAEIPLFEGERVIILDPLAQRLTWPSGRVYPLMRPTLRIDSQLSPDDAAARLAKARPAKFVGTYHTEDLSVWLPPGHDVAELVDVVLRAALRDTPADDLERLLIDQFGMPPDDAFLARDRTEAGLVRAASRNPENRPDPAKDPVAAQSYRRALADPTLVQRLLPDLAG